MPGVFRAGGFVLLLLGFSVFVWTLAGWSPELLASPTFATGALAAAFTLGLTLVYAGGNPGRRALIRLPAAGLAATAVEALAIVAFDVDAARGTLGDESLLIAAAVVAGIVAIALAASGSRLTGLPEPPHGAAAQQFTRVERVARLVLRSAGAASLVGAAAAALLPFVDTADDFTQSSLLVAATVGGSLSAALLCLWIGADLRSRLTLAAIPAVCAASCAALGAAQAWKVDLGQPVELPGAQPSMGLLVISTLAAAALGAVGLLTLYNRAWKARYGLRFLWPVSHRGLLAIADVLLEPERRQSSPDQIATRVEGFLLDFKAQRRWLYRIALAALQCAPLLELSPRPRINPPLLELDRWQRRRFLEANFQRLPQQRAWRLIKHLRQVMVRVAQQLTYAGYYGSESSYTSIGYQPFTQRERFRDLEVTEPGEHPLDVELPADVDPEELIADVCVVGTGAAGSILAYELAKQGYEVLMLERGDYVQPREFSENEIEMIGRLYSDGLMQQTEDWRFTILQGSCVGGSTTVNNAVCFRPPQEVLDRWNDPAVADAALDLDRLQESVSAVESFLGVTPQNGAFLNRGADRILDGARELGLVGEKFEIDVVRANVHECFGSGYCNMGCRWGKKLSMLDVTLPRAQREFPGKVRIVAECEVVKILTKRGQPVEVTGLIARLGGHREVTVKARDRYVLACGAVASSYLLLRSGVGKGLPVGERFSANMGAPIVGEFEAPQRAYDGLQISHYGRPLDDRYIFETWFNPPVAQALNMPGWFERHFENMLRYDHLVAAGVLVGTANTGTVGRSWTGATVDFRPSANDLKTLARGLRQVGQILFAGGATRVMVNTWGADEYTAPEQLGDLDRVCADPDYIALGTGHPQGGNALSRDPRRGVVGPDFRVHGHSNLLICDASVFPSSVTVNPQLTVMALAHYAAEPIGQGARA